MKFIIAKNLFRRNLPDVLRHVGYFSILDSKQNKLSFIRHLSKSQNYPRFHLYIQETASDYQFSLHLDQKQASYIGQTAHSGEYDTDIMSGKCQAKLNNIFQTQDHIVETAINCKSILS